MLCLSNSFRLLVYFTFTFFGEFRYFSFRFAAPASWRPEEECFAKLIKKEVLLYICVSFPLFLINRFTSPLHFVSHFSTYFLLLSFILPLPHFATLFISVSFLISFQLFPFSHFTFFIFCLCVSLFSSFLSSFFSFLFLAYLFYHFSSFPTCLPSSFSSLVFILLNLPIFLFLLYLYFFNFLLFYIFLLFLFP